MIKVIMNEFANGTIKLKVKKTTDYGNNEK